MVHDWPTPPCTHTTPAVENVYEGLRDGKKVGDRVGGFDGRKEGVTVGPLGEAVGFTEGAAVIVPIVDCTQGQNRRWPL